MLPVGQTAAHSPQPTQPIYHKGTKDTKRRRWELAEDHPGVEAVEWIGRAWNRLPKVFICNHLRRLFFVLSGCEPGAEPVYLSL